MPLLSPPPLENAAAFAREAAALSYGLAHPTSKARAADAAALVALLSGAAASPQLAPEALLFVARFLAGAPAASAAALARSLPVLLDAGLLAHVLAPAALPTDDAALAQLLVSLPDRAANALSAPLPDALAPAAYFPRLRRAVFDALLSLPESGPGPRLLPSGDDDHGGTPDDFETLLLLAPPRPTLAALPRLCEAIARLARRGPGEAAQLGREWARTAYQRAGAGGCRAAYLLESRTGGGVCGGADDAPEWPTASLELARAQGVGRAGRVLVDCVPAPQLAAFLLELLLAAAEIALDSVACTPVAARRGVSEPLAEAHFGESLSGILLACLGPATSLPYAALRWLQADLVFRRPPLPGIVSRALLLFLLQPLVRTVATPAGASGNASADFVARTHGYIAAPPANAALTSELRGRAGSDSDSSALLAAWLTRVPALEIASRWAHASAGGWAEDATLQASVSRVLVQQLLLLPGAAFSASCALVPSVLAGVQARIDAPQGDAVRQIAMRVAHAFALRSGATMSARRRASGEGGAAVAAGNDGGAPSPEQEFAQLADAQGGDLVLDLSIGEALARARDGRRLGIGDSGPTTSVRPHALSECPSGGAAGDPGLPSVLAERLRLPLAPQGHASSGSPRPRPEPESLRAARAAFARRAPSFLRTAYARLLALSRDDGSGGGGSGAALPVPGGAALDEDAEAVAGTPDGAVALLSTLERLVRAAAEDGGGGGQAQLLELAVPLMRALLAAGNRFGLRDVPAWRFCSLVAITACAAPLAARLLVAGLSFGAGGLGGTGDSTEAARLEGLDILVAAARELSGEGTGEGGRGPGPLVAPLPPWERAAWRPDVVDDINDPEDEGVDARRGAGADAEEGAEDALLALAAARRATGLLPRTNLFSGLVARHFFFPLLRALLQATQRSSSASLSLRASDPDLDLGPGTGLGTELPALSDAAFPVLAAAVGGGAGELAVAQAVRALAVFLELAGVSCPDAPRMARALLPLAWLLGSSGPAAAKAPGDSAPPVGAGVLVRRAALSAVAAVVAAVFRQRESLLASPSVLSGMGGPEAVGSEADVGVAAASGTASKHRPVSSVLAELSSVGARLSRRKGLALVAARAAGVGVVEGAVEGLVLWDDLVRVVVWLRAVADADADAECRALASAMLANEILRSLVLGEFDSEGEAVHERA